MLIDHSIRRQGLVRLGMFKAQLRREGALQRTREGDIIGIGSLGNAARGADGCGKGRLGDGRCHPSDGQVADDSGLHGENGGFRLSQHDVSFFSS